MASTTRNNDAALSAFMQAKAEIDTLLAQIQQASNSHFGTNPERLPASPQVTLSGLVPKWLLLAC